jgi:hypothetical protein
MLRGFDSRGLDSRSKYGSACAEQWGRRSDRLLDSGTSRRRQSRRRGIEPSELEGEARGQELRGFAIVCA